MKVNKEIRAPKVRLISKDGEQVGIVLFLDALRRAEEDNLDLVEVVPTASPPVCKIMDYGKYRYDQTKREKESKKSQHQIKVKEVKLKPNIDEHDYMVKMKKAKEFLSKGNKVKVTLMYRGREMAHSEYGVRLVERLCNDLVEVGTVESSPKRMGRFLTVVIAPSSNKKK